MEMESFDTQLDDGLRLESAASRPDLWEIASDEAHPLNIIWPPWMTEPDNPHWEALGEIEELARYQTMVVKEPDEQVVAIGLCVPFYWPELADRELDLDGSIRWALSLPDRGWDAMLARGALQAKARSGNTPEGADAGPHQTDDDQRLHDSLSRSREPPNALSAMLVNVMGDYKGAGIADALLLNFKALARQHGLKALVVPLRPTLKGRYPDVSMEEYLTWAQGKPNQPGTFAWSLDRLEKKKNEPEAGGDQQQAPVVLPFDPWLRKHIRMGARVVKIAPESLVKEAPAAAWREWLEGKIELDTSTDDDGKVIVLGEKLDGFKHDGRPVYWDAKRQVGRYVETDIWVLHQL